MASGCAIPSVLDISVFGHSSSWACRILAGGGSGVRRTSRVGVSFRVKVRVRDRCPLHFGEDLFLHCSDISHQSHIVVMYDSENV